ncbi:MAG TPA: hypothetical protein VGE52_02415 [Pirellulales bacterium]
MLTRSVILAAVVSEPFRPFRIRMASGRTFEIRHPEMIEVGRSSATVWGHASEDGSRTELFHRVSMMLMESLEPLEAAPQVQ